MITNAGPVLQERSSADAAEDAVVMPFTQGLEGHGSVHEKTTRREIARRLAQLKGCEFSEEIPRDAWAARTYLVPSETLVGLGAADDLGIHDESDFFGGVVPEAFIASKVITHPLSRHGAVAPASWSPDFCDMVKEAVLPGYSAFSRKDALHAAEKLLALGPLRVKQVWETGGRGQTVATDLADVANALAHIGDTEIKEHGVVLEHNLTKVETLSVGQVRVAGMVAAYYGYQKLTPNNTGGEAYGGSDLTVVRGGFEALLAIIPSGPIRTAVEQALLYDSAATVCFPGFFASRTNYDVAQGLNAAGQWCSGVLEQSWRMGGATPAEIAALEAFQANPKLQTVRACCFEKFGPFKDLGNLPASAALYFQGDDPEIGLLTKYALVEEDGNTTQKHSNRSR